MTIHMVTVDRSANGGTNYLARTLESFAEALPTKHLTLFVGNRETGYLPDCGFNVEVMDKTTVKRIARKPARYRATVNYWLALRACPADEDLLLLEDDIVFTTRFEQKLAICLEAIPVGEFVLACFTQHQLRQYPVQQRRCSDYSGTLCMFIPHTIRTKLAEFINNQLGEWRADDPQCDVAHDVLIQRFCHRENIPIYSANPSLVNHIGLTSTIVPPKHSIGLGIAYSFYHGKPTTFTQQSVTSFCTFATHGFSDELRIAVKACELFHPGVPFYVLSDSITAKEISAEFPHVITKVEADPEHLKQYAKIYHSRLSNRHRGEAHHPHGIFLLKMKAVDHALSLHPNTVFLDADVTLTAPIEPLPNCDIAVAQHWFDPTRPDMEGTYGSFNAGIVYVANRDFTKWWRENYLSWGFTDQGCLIDAPGLFDVHPLPWTHNYGHWRLWDNTIGKHIDCVNSPVEDIADFCGFQMRMDGIYLHGQRLKSFHVHLLNDISSLPPANLALRKLALFCLRQSGSSAHQQLHALYLSLAARAQKDVT